MTKKQSNSGIQTSLHALVEALEAAAARLPAEPTIDDFTRLVEERREPAEALGAMLATIDPSTLEVPERRALAARLRRVLEKDQMLTAALFARRDDVAAELSRIAHARRAAAAARNSARPVRRVA